MREAKRKTTKKSAGKAPLGHGREHTSFKTMDEIDKVLDGIKKNIVLEIIKNSKSNAEAARTLGISPARLYYFLDKWRHET